VLLPADIDPYITQALVQCRRRITRYEELIAEGTASPEELAAYADNLTLYEDTLALLLSILS